MPIQSDWQWVIPFAIVDNLNRIFYGMYGTLLGPSQPYLAKNVSVGIDTINWIQPFGSAAGLIGAILAAMIFKKYFVSANQKLSYLILLTLLTGITSILPVYCSSLPALIFVISLRMFFGQMLEVPCQGMYVYTLGSQVSQPFIMFFHCTVGMGFLLGPVMIRPFFPEESPNDRNHVCQFENYNDTNDDIMTDISNTNDNDFDLNVVLDSIKWPFYFTLIGHLICALGYAIVSMLPYEMPVHDEQKLIDKQTSKSNSSKSDNNGADDLWTLVIILVFFCSICGSERLFQSLEFTFGLCGPLKLSAKMAVIIDDCFNGGFFIGRLLSVLAVNFMTPKLMLKFSLILCTLSTLLLSLEADNSVTLLYICTALFGFAISWQWGSAFSWSAENLDVVGPKASIFSIGCSMGSISPIIGGYLFHRWTPMALWHLNMILVFGQLMGFLGLKYKFRSAGVAPDENNDYSYKELQQMDEIDLSTSDDED